MTIDSNVMQIVLSKNEYTIPSQDLQHFDHIFNFLTEQSPAIALVLQLGSLSTHSGIARDEEKEYYI